MDEIEAVEVAEEVSGSRLLRLDSDERSALATEIDEHITTLNTILSTYRDRWDRYIKLYKAVVDQLVKEFPWEGASNIFAPELRNQVDTIASFVLGSTIRQNPPYPIKSLRGTDADVTEAAIKERFLAFYTSEVQQHEHYWRRHLPYLILLGSHPLKIRMTTDSRLGYPLVEFIPISLHRFLAYPSISDLSVNPFVADVSWVSPEQILSWEKKGLFDHEVTKTVLSGKTVSSVNSELFSTYRIEDGSIPGTFVPIFDGVIHFAGDDIAEPARLIRFVYHSDTKTVLWAEDFTDQLLPYRVINWLHDEDQLFGFGVGDLAWTLQVAYNTTINQAIDNATLANTRFFVVPPGSGVTQGERLYPGRVITSSMAEKVRVFAMGDVYSSAFVMPSSIRQMLQNSTGSSDSFLGMPDQVTKTRHTAQGQAMNLSATANRLDLSSAELEDGLVDLAWTTLTWLARYSSGEEFHLPPQLKVTKQKMLEALLSGDTAGDGDIRRVLTAALSEEEADVVEKSFMVPEEILSRKRFKITVARRTANKATERESAIVLAQLVEKYLSGVTQLAQTLTQIQGQPGMELLANTLVEVWKASNRAMQRVLISFSVEDSADLLVELQEVQNALAGFGQVPSPGVAGGVAVPGGPDTGNAEGTGGAIDRFGTALSGMAGANAGVQGASGVSPTLAEEGRL